jgi:hypothetical protein
MYVNTLKVQVCTTLGSWSYVDGGNVFYTNLAPHIRTENKEYVNFASSIKARYVKILP